MRADRRPQIVPAALLAALIAAAPGFAQDVQVAMEPAEAPDVQAIGPEPVVYLSSNLVQGELLRVDIEAGRFVVKQQDGSEMELSLGRRTTLLGAEDIRDLAVHAGSRVSVKFSRRDGDKVATSVRVHPKIETRQRRYPPL